MSGFWIKLVKSKGAIFTECDIDRKDEVITTVCCVEPGNKYAIQIGIEDISIIVEITDQHIEVFKELIERY